MHSDRPNLVHWIAAEILPHEGIVRNWLARRWAHALEVDDVMQEAYCRLSELEAFEHIRNPRAYFFRTVQSVAIDLLRAAKVANAVKMTEIEWEYVMDEGPTPDKVTEDQRLWQRFHGLLSDQSETCRQVIVLRRLHGLSQADTARRLGVSENVVENHMSRGLKRLLQALSELPASEQPEGGQAWTSQVSRTTGTRRRRNGRRALRTEA